MNRIEELKETWKRRSLNEDEVQLLFSRLEIADTVLENVLTEYGYDHIEPSDRLKEIEYIVQDALQQLRS